MPKINMDADGRFGNLFKTTANEKDISLEDVAKHLDYSYEQMRKLVQNRSLPSPEVLRTICKFTGMDRVAAEQAVIVDKMERDYGIDALYAAVGKNPRLADVDPYLSQLDDGEWRMFVAQIAGYVRERSRMEKKAR